MITLLAPLGLTALAALLIPILLHLLRRPQQDVIEFAALRWLSPRSKPRERLRIVEWLLLVLRLLLIATLAALLAAPAWRQAVPAQQRWVALAPGVDPGSARAALPAQAGDAAWHWIAPDFPTVDGAVASDAESSTAAPLAANARPATLASLLRQFEAQLPPAAALVVVVPEDLGGLDAASLSLGRRVDWRVLPGRSPQSRADAVGQDAGLRVSVHAAAQPDAARHWAEALAAAWRVQGQRVDITMIAADAPPPADADLLLWWADDAQQPLPAALAQWVSAGGTALLAPWTLAQDGTVALWTGSGTALLYERDEGLGRLLWSRDSLAPGPRSESAQPEFAERLLRLLRPASTASPQAPDRGDAQALTPTVGERYALGPLRDLSPWLVWLAALLFLAERLCAWWRSRRPQ